MKPIVAGLISALPLSGLILGYMLIRGRVFTAAILKAEPEPGGMSLDQMYYLLLGAFPLMPLVFGIAAGLVYSRIGNPVLFLGIALGVALVLSVLAFTSRLPLPWGKTAANFAFALMFGLLVPLLTGN